ncbi:MAG: hypothetical protein DMG48_19560 [Acidobacteria bacterium]|nr:MAG: hypothetical protein DMG48_19560 [Acidobacteriota bacterium]
MKRMLAFCFLLGVPSLLLAQAPAKPSFMDAGIIEHRGTGGTLTANDPRPLRQAIEAISQEYGWTVDFEEPPYRSHFDLVDSTDPVWRANHPNAKGATRVSGGFFQSNFREPATVSSGDEEEQVLQKLASDYNASGNPGKFVVRKEAEGRYAVIGVSRRDDAGRDEAVDVLLDTVISIPVLQRSARETLRLIVDTLSATSGVKVYLGTVGLSSDPLQDVELTIGGSNIPARTLLLQALDGVSSWTPPHGGQFFRGILVWNLLFDADRNDYRLGLSTAAKAETDANGKRVIRFLKHK